MFITDQNHKKPETCTCGTSLFSGTSFLHAIE